MLQLFLLSALMFSSAAFAADERAIDFTQPLFGVGHKPIVVCSVKINPGEDCPKEAQVPYTLGDAAVAALEATLDEDRNMAPLDRFKLDAIARTIYQNSSAKLSVDQIAKIKERIGKALPTMYVGAAWPLLDPTVDGGGK